ncbi:MAG: methionine biosynthesis protein MetW, partial [Candidatus Omnitrophica bacterium]|nr:methionine biosynthesis protein MetW [Candidatus Omnitrophota bacterium]
MTKEAKRPDHEVIYGIVEPGSRVLDLGCGEGDLLYLLTKGKGVKAQGVELSEAAIYKCVEKGLSVFHGDIDSGLNDYPDRSFDYVILNQSMQEVKKVDFVIDEALRVGGRVIVGFPNFAYWRARLRLFLKGKTPVTYSLPYRWYNTPNLHFLSISDFKEFCADKGITIESEHFLGRNGTSRFLPNIFALNA